MRRYIAKWNDGKSVFWIFVLFLMGFDIGISNSFNQDKIIDSLQVNQWGLVSLSTINIRKEPNQQSELISQSIMGMPLQILKKTNKWLYIKTIDGYKGWTNYYSIKIFDNQQTLVDFWGSSSLYIFTDYFGIVHSLPNLHSPVVSDIVFNNMVRVTKKVANFYEIILPNGKKGYLEKQKLKNWNNWVNETKYHPNALPTIAEKFLGFPYSWGGASIKGMDCSSFMQLIFFQQGIVLPRDARLQIALGNEVDTTEYFKNLMVGDLLFFGKKDITHVAMYIGNQKYIHCFGEVKINSLDSSSIDYNRMLKNLLIKVKRLQKADILNLTLSNSLYHFLER